jgi:hypothetical protein
MSSPYSLEHLADATDQNAVSSERSHTDVLDGNPSQLSSGVGVITPR